MKKFQGLSLQQQITFAGVLVFGVALFGIACGHWLSARAMLSEQLMAQVQGTASALARSLSVAMEGGKGGVVDPLRPAQGDGVASNIVLRDSEGRIVDSFTAQEQEKSGVPAWFSHMVGLEAPTAEARVVSSRQQIGRVEVEAQPQQALQQLWRDTWRMVGWLLLVYAVAIVVMALCMRRLMAPLHAVEVAAQAVSERRFLPIPELAQTRELKRFIAGFNRLVHTVNQQLETEERRAEHFRSRMLTDELTGLPNRAALNAWLSSQAVSPGRWFALIEVDGMLDLNRAQGYAAGDELVLAIAAILRQGFSADAYVARLGAATFVVVHMANGDAGARIVAARIMADVNACLRSFNLAGLNCGGGWAPAAAGGAVSRLLATADRALAMARARGNGHFGLLSEDSAPPELRSLGANAWLDWVGKAIAAGQYSLSVQNVFAVPERQPVQREVFLRLHGEGGMTVSALTFLPLVQRAGEADLLDRRMLELLFLALRRGELDGGALAVNLSAASWRSGRFCKWLLEQLADWPVAQRPVFELNETDVAEDMSRAAHFAETLRAVGADVGLDHFGVAPGGIACLRKVLPCYVKLDASLLQGLETVERRFQVEALVRVARTLNIPVWAQLSGDDAMLELLQEMGISGAQGHVLAGEISVSLPPAERH